MKSVLPVLVGLLLAVTLVWEARGQNQHGADTEDNEFAEFEDFDEDSEYVDSEDDAIDETVEAKSPPKSESSSSAKSEPNEFGDEDDEFEDEDATVEVEGESEFENLDPEEFEGLDGDDTIWDNDNKGKKKLNRKEKPKLKIENVPLHIRSWDKYYVEIMMCFALIVYMLNFITGRYTNSTIANSWLKVHQEFLESQFELVGDDPQNKTALSTMQMTKEAEHVFTLWCSGRVCVEGMLVELRLIKRQDLVSMMFDKLKPIKDQIMITVTLEDMDPYILAVGTKKTVGILQKQMQDIISFCVDKMRPADKYDLPDNMMVVSEIWGEVGNVLDAKIRKVIKENEKYFDYLHISDQYSGAKPSDADEAPTEKPPTSKRLSVLLNMHCEKGSPGVEDLEKLLPLMKMTLYMADKMKKLRLTKEAKAKADKNRRKVEDAYLKLTHARRQEEAQIKREEKEKAIKERIMNEEDPDKQRKLEEIQNKREARKRDKKLYKSKQMRARVM